MPDQELMRMLIKASQDAGFYKGLLEGLILQAKDKGQHYEVDHEVFELMKKGVEEHK